jgi:hypothetical protein
MTSFSGDPYAVAGEKFTAGALNGKWWTQATELERRIYLTGWTEGWAGARTDGMKVFSLIRALDWFYAARDESIPVKEALRPLMQPVIDA